MEGFTVGLALLDYVPVAAFGAAVLFIGFAVNSPLFFIGAGLIILSGLIKATWKLILGISRKDIKWMNKCFFPVMGIGFLLVIVSILINIKSINWAGFWPAVTGLPQLLFFIIWLLVLVFMTVFKKTKFRRDNARDNWIGEILNSVGMVCLLIGVLTAVF